MIAADLEGKIRRLCITPTFDELGDQPPLRARS